MLPAPKPPRGAPLSADLAVLAGAACALVGLWWIFPPAALIVGGVGLVVAGLLGGGR